MHLTYILLFIVYMHWDMLHGYFVECYYYNCINYYYYYYYILIIIINSSIYFALTITSPKTMAQFSLFMGLDVVEVVVLFSVCRDFASWLTSLAPAHGNTRQTTALGSTLPGA